MKSILISIRPEWVAKILNGEKTIEIRKTAPKCDLPIDVYIYCTKGAPYLAYESIIDEYSIYKTLDEIGEHGRVASPTTNLIALQDDGPMTNGKVVAKFTLKKVEKFIQGLNEAEYERLPNFALKDYDYYGLEDLMEKACLNDEEINKYAPDLSFCAWHISDLEIFDEPKPLEDFYSTDATKFKGIEEMTEESKKKYQDQFYKIKSAPQSWRYVEVEE